MQKLLVMLIALLLITTIPITALAESVRITDRNPDHQYFDYQGSSGWTDLMTPNHMIRDSSSEVVAYCLEHKNDSPGSTYYNSTNTPFSYFSSTAYKGMLIILEYGYP
ncbi:MAG: thioester domain-containing protein [Clostridiales bacterium]|nr:thioester domain-containing protein [Clostridiales bacterium]